MFSYIFKQTILSERLLLYSAIFSYLYLHYCFNLLLCYPSVPVSLFYMYEFVFSSRVSFKNSRKLSSLLYLMVLNHCCLYLLTFPLSFRHFLIVSQSKCWFCWHHIFFFFFLSTQDRSSAIYCCFVFHPWSSVKFGIKLKDKMWIQKILQIELLCTIKCFSLNIGHLLCLY